MNKQKLFNELSINLSFYKNIESGDQFVCPICLESFNSINRLTKAHIIPQALGGKSFTLTCAKCNNNVGSSIESYEIDRVRFHNAFLGDGTSYWKANLIPIHKQDVSKIGKVTAEITFINDEKKPTIKFNLLKKGSSPKALDEFKNIWGKSSSMIQVETQVRGNWNRAKLTYLHAAYLFLFSQLGYEWVLEPCNQIVRDQIINPERELIPFAPLEINNCELTYSLNNQNSCSWYLIVEPIESVGFLVIFSSLKHLQSPIGVWMPLPGRSYQQITKVFNFEVKPLPNLQEHLSNPESIFLGIKHFLEHFFN